MNISANWIWSDDGDGRGYNLCSIFRRDFRLEAVPADAHLAVCADSSYRLKVNGQWLGDGPGRSYPGHTRYDLYDLAGVLRSGANQIEAVVRYFGCGNFHQLPQRAGFLAQLEMTMADGAVETLVTDSNWFAAPLPQWVENTPPISIQQPPFECFDASVHRNFDWKNASIVCAAEAGPWKNLAPRDCPPLTRREALLRRVESAHRVMPELVTIGIAPQRILFPGDISVQTTNILPCFVAFEVDSPEEQEIPIAALNIQVSANGVVAKEGRIELRRGRNFLVFGVDNLSGHSNFQAIGFYPESGIDRGRIANCTIAELRDLAVLLPDLPFPWASTEFQTRRKAYEEARAKALRCRNFEEFRKLWPSARPLKEEELTDAACHFSFECRRAEQLHAGDVEHLENLIYPDDRMTVIHPVERRDIELCCDLGEENIGYWNFALVAPAGTVVDLSVSEYISETGRIQHTGLHYRHSMRYICREGWNRFTSFQRRGGRYLFVTLRRMTAPVRIQSLRLVESTYPVVEEGTFRCSDLELEKVYEISRRTLKLCMEDTFTDCPLYEQTLWVGDARSESLFAMSCFGAYDLVRRCIRLAGQSLDRLPLVGSQVPSSWDNIIPAWSFMWVISIFDYYEETGDLEFVREVRPMMAKNLAGAESMIDSGTGLFSCPAWNLFDWSRTKCEFRIMLYNSLFLIGALDAAIKLGEALEEQPDEVAHWREFRAALAETVNRAWDARKLAWPDSIDENGRPSEDVSVHTSMLAVIYDVAVAAHQAEVRTNVLSPRSELIPVASPFASLYFYEALEKLGVPGEIVDAIRRDYRPMLRAGASTVWETYARAFSHVGDFPTRSHCHGWSAAPLYYLPRLVLGIVPEGIGGRRFRISPRVSGLEYAAGTRPTVHGRIEVRWEKSGRSLAIHVKVPEGVEVEFQANDTTCDMEVTLNIVHSAPGLPSA